MRRIVRARAESVLAVVAGALAVVTAIWPTWIETLVEVSPDAGSGETEWGLVAVFLAVAVAATLMAGRDLRSTRRGGRAASDAG